MRKIKERIKHFAPIRKMLLNRLARKQGYSPMDINQGKLLEGETGKYADLKFVDTIQQVERIAPLFQKRGLCLFAHFDKDGCIDPWVVEYLKRISEQGFDIIVSSASPHLPQSLPEKFHDIVSIVLRRENIGLDFGSWSAALDFIGLEINRYSELLLCNDSVLGPFGKLDRIFQKARKMRCDIFGLTDSWEFAYHLQSYFLFFKKPAFHAQSFRNFWNQIKVYENKLNIIHQYEIGLSTYFGFHGYRLDALVRYQDVCRLAVKRNLVQEDLLQALKNDPQNPTLVLWDILIEHFGFPFIKGELLRKNPHNHTRVGLWSSLVPSSPKMSRLIERYLERLKSSSSELATP